MNEELELLKSIAEKFESADIEYMLTGSMAMAFYSTPRMTRDIDIIIQISGGDVDKIIDLFHDDFYIEEESVRRAVLNRGIFNIIHNDSIIKVDLIIRKDEKYRIEEFTHKKKIPVEGVSISVAAPEDLILSKLVWSKQSQSELQFRDVRQMMMVLKELNYGYLEKWAKVLHVDDLLRKVKEHD
jgi:hypothetical protein